MCSIICAWQGERGAVKVLWGCAVVDRRHLGLMSDISFYFFIFSDKYNNQTISALYSDDVSVSHHPSSPEAVFLQLYSINSQWQSHSVPLTEHILHVITSLVRSSTNKYNWLYILWVKTICMINSHKRAWCAPTRSTRNYILPQVLCFVFQVRDFERAAHWFQKNAFYVKLSLSRSQTQSWCWSLLSLMLRI